MLIEGDQGALPLDPAKGSSTLWTPIRAIQLVTLPCYARVFIRERGKEAAIPQMYEDGDRKFPKGDRRLRLFALPFGRLRRGEIPCVCLFLRHQKQKWACHFAQNAI